MEYVLINANTLDKRLVSDLSDMFRLITVNPFTLNGGIITPSSAGYPEYVNTNLTPVDNSLVLSLNNTFALMVRGTIPSADNILGLITYNVMESYVANRGLTKPVRYIDIVSILVDNYDYVKIMLNLLNKMLRHSNYYPQGYHLSAYPRNVGLFSGLGFQMSGFTATRMGTTRASNEFSIFRPHDSTSLENILTREVAPSGTMSSQALIQSVICKVADAYNAKLKRSVISMNAYEMYKMNDSQTIVALAPVNGHWYIVKSGESVVGVFSAEAFMGTVRISSCFILPEFECKRDRIERAVEYVAYHVLGAVNYIYWTKTGYKTDLTFRDSRENALMHMIKAFY